MLCGYDARRWNSQICNVGGHVVRRDFPETVAVAVPCSLASHVLRSNMFKSSCEILFICQVLKIRRPQTISNCLPSWISVHFRQVRNCGGSHAERKAKGKVRWVPCLQDLGTEMERYGRWPRFAGRTIWTCVTYGIVFHDGLFGLSTCYVAGTYRGMSHKCRLEGRALPPWCHFC